MTIKTTPARMDAPNKATRQLSNKAVKLNKNNGAAAQPKYPVTPWIE